MRVNHLLSAILKGPFAVQHETVLGYLPRVAQLLSGEGLAPDAAATTPPEASVQVVAAAPSVAIRSRKKSYDEALPGSVAVFDIKGVMMKADQWGLCEDVPGTASIGRALQEADQHENIAAHVLNIDSGGGSVDGMIEFNAIIAGLKKPVVAYSDGCIASAAYSAASGTRLIVLNNVSCAVGSIGVMASLIDYQPVLEKMGVKFHTLRATGSERKNEDFYQLLQGNHKPYTANVLTPLKEMMHEAVRAGRGKKLNAKALLGDMYFAEQAIMMGLADEIGDFTHAVTRALELAGQATPTEAVEEEIETDPENPEAPDTLHDDDENDIDDDPNATKSTINTMFGKNTFKAAGALAGLTGAAMTAELVSAANEELEAKGITDAAFITKADHTALTAKQSAKDGKCPNCGQEMAADGKPGQAAEQLAAMTAALQAAGVESVAALVASRDAAVKQAAEFGGQAGELPTNALKLKGDVQETGPNANQLLIDGLAHNQGLDNNPLFN